MDGPAELRLDRFLPYRLSVAANLVSDRIATAYQALFGLRIPEWRLIAVLAESGPVTQQALVQRTRMDKVTVSRAAIALVTRGLVERTPHAHDARSRLLALSADGRALYEKVVPKALELEQRMLAGLSPDDVAKLFVLLERLETTALEDGDPM
ncbi:MarR family winged helix-turn-helix transcriptional regulator [Flavisphingomonas formosensis]|uniref:MarR family winged helix-turn-helix transcriptional regulator n=1 Tax=Flavisphingomonas formosensis TaxID=861534 RepID=UPI0012FBEAEA|nr:MarR family transcriptional regulator [Sphingomonas formosensis]